MKYKIGKSHGEHETNGWTLDALELKSSKHRKVIIEALNSLGYQSRVDYTLVNESEKKKLKRWQRCH